MKIRGWSEAVKGLWDADPDRDCPLHVAILGSVPLLMQAGLSESLGGRFEPVGVTHWSFPEMSDAFGFDLEQFVYCGGYPGAARLIHDFERWRAYVREALIEPNIERDVLSMTRVDKPALLKRLFELGALYSGQELSYNKMLGQLQDAGNTVTLRRYLTLLANAGLLTGLSKHTERPVLARGSSPKLNVLNTALMAVVSGYTFDEARADRSQWGRMVESAVGAHLHNTASPRTDVRYWRDGDREVDFVLHRGPRTVAIEVKSGKRSAGRSGLAEFEPRERLRVATSCGLSKDSGIKSQEYRHLTNCGWSDSWRQRPRLGVHATVLHDNPLLPPVELPSYLRAHADLPGRAANFDYTLDYQFMRPETLRADHAWTFGGAADGYPSDHLGVAVDYSVL